MSNGPISTCLKLYQPFKGKQFNFSIQKPVKELNTLRLAKVDRPTGA